MIETLVAFANTKGGKVILGCNDQRNIIGVTIGHESIQKWVNEIKQNTNPQIVPDVAVEKIDEKDIVIFDVIEYPVKPVSYRNKYFKRVMNSNHVMSLNEISNEYLKTINSSWDYYIDSNHSIDTLSEEKIIGFIKKVEKQTNRDITIPPYDFLSKMEIIRENKPTFGAYLLFAKDYCINSDVQVGRFKSEITIIDSLSLNTDLFTEVNEIIAFIRKHLMVEYIITGEPQRTERFDFPLDAIREIVINMIVHRDYRESSASVIKIFDDRIEFFNPGNLYGGITVDDLLTGNYSSQARNKLIAGAFKEVGLIERYGSGIQRILNICKDYGVKPPSFEEKSNGFNVTLYKEKLENVTENVTENKILLLIKKTPNITTTELATEIGVTRRTIARYITKLKTQNKIKRIGPDKGGFWEVVKDI